MKKTTTKTYDKAADSGLWGSPWKLHTGVSHSIRACKSAICTFDLR